MQKIEKRSYHRLTAGRAKSYSFIALPSEIIYGGKFKISPAAKILYAAMLGRASLSERSATERSAFVDKDGYIYIYFTNADVCEILDCGKNTATKYIKELLDSGLIERKAQGLGKAVRYYVMDFSDYAGADEEAGIELEDVTSEPDEPEELPTEPDEPEELPTEPEESEELVAETAENSRSQKMGVWTPKDRDTPSPLPKIGSLESQKMGVWTPRKLGTNKIKENKREISQIEGQSIPPNLPLEGEGRTDEQSMISFSEIEELEKEVKEQISYEILVGNGAHVDSLDCIVAVMVDALSQKCPARVGDTVLTDDVVKERLQDLGYEEIKYVLGNLYKANNVRNPRKYLLAMLLNAKCDYIIDVELCLNRDMPHLGEKQRWNKTSRADSYNDSDDDLDSDFVQKYSKRFDDFLAELG